MQKLIIKQSMIKKILNYHAIIILFYEFILLTIFWLVTGFVFKNNNSFILLFLMIVPPLVLYIAFRCLRKKNNQKFNDYHSSYFTLIKKDIKSAKIEELLIKPIKEILTNLFYKVTDKQIYINGGSKDKITILIEENLTTLLIDNTRIIYQYIYDFKGIDVTKYDYKGIKKYPTTKLYNLILNQTTILANKNLNYTEFYIGKKITGCKLESEKTLYLINNNEKHFLKKQKEKNTTLYI